MIANIKDEYARGYGAEDWSDYIDGMNSRDVEYEMVEILTIYHNFLLKLYENIKSGDRSSYINLAAYCYNVSNWNELDEDIKLIEVLK